MDGQVVRHCRAWWCGNVREFVLITRADVEKVAMLARLELSDAELDRMTADLGAILDHIQVLAELPLQHVGPTSQVLQLRNVMREDVIRPSLPVEAVLANAPDREEGSFRVRAVLE
jgi:aspartyl-tRNA(Asn)/glutamyl-tRNA(Gln) amidotransferase subunit C